MPARAVTVDGYGKSLSPESSQARQVEESHRGARRGTTAYGPGRVDWTDPWEERMAGWGGGK